MLRKNNNQKRYSSNISNLTKIRKQKNSSYYYYILCRRNIDQGTNKFLKEFFAYETRGLYKNNVPESDIWSRKPGALRAPGLSGAQKKLLKNSNRSNLIQNYLANSLLANQLNIEQRKLANDPHVGELIVKDTQGISTIKDMSDAMLSGKVLKTERFKRLSVLLRKTESLIYKKNRKVTKNFPTTGTISTRFSHLFSENDENGEKSSGFFPYKKSFLCYWLLPLVGFLSSATLSLSKQNDLDSLLKNSTSSVSSTDFLLRTPRDLQSWRATPRFQNDEKAHPTIGAHADTRALRARELNPRVSSKRGGTGELFHKNKTETNLNWVENNDPAIFDRESYAGYLRDNKLSRNNLKEIDEILSNRVARTISDRADKNSKRTFDSSLTAEKGRTLNCCMFYLNCLENELKFSNKNEQNDSGSTLSNRLAPWNLMKTGISASYQNESTKDIMDMKFSDNPGSQHGSRGSLLRALGLDEQCSLKNPRVSSKRGGKAVNFFSEKDLWHRAIFDRASPADIQSIVGLKSLFKTPRFEETREGQFNSNYLFSFFNRSLKPRSSHYMLSGSAFNLEKDDLILNSSNYSFKSPRKALSQDTFLNKFGMEPFKAHFNIPDPPCFEETRGLNQEISLFYPAFLRNAGIANNFNFLSTNSDNNKSNETKFNLLPRVSSKRGDSKDFLDEKMLELSITNNPVHTDSSANKELGLRGIPAFPRNAGLKDENFSLKNRKNNPVISFVRASSLLDKYLIFKGIFENVQCDAFPPRFEETRGKIPRADVSKTEHLQELFARPRVSSKRGRKGSLNNEKAFSLSKFNIQPQIINTLFSYFSKRNSRGPFTPRFEETRGYGHSGIVDTTNLKMLYTSDFVDNQLIRDHGVSVLPVLFQKHGGTATFEGITLLKNDAKKQYSVKTENKSLADSTFSEQEKKLQGENPLLGNSRSSQDNRSQGHAVFQKLSKEKIYNIVLDSLKYKIDESRGTRDGEGHIAHASFGHKANIISDQENLARGPISKTNYSTQGISSKRDSQQSYTNTSTRAEPSLDPPALFLKLKHPLFISNYKVYSFPPRFEETRGFNKISNFQKSTQKTVKQNQQSLWIEPLLYSPRVSSKRGDYIEVPADKARGVSDQRPYELSGSHPQSPSGLRTLGFNPRLLKTWIFNNEYFGLQKYIQNYINYRLKDYFILNKITTYTKPIQEISHEYFQHKTPMINESSTMSSIHDATSSIPEETRIETEQSSIARATKLAGSMLTPVYGEFDSKFQSDKTGKLLRAYFSIKKNNQKSNSETQLSLRTNAKRAMEDSEPRDLRSRRLRSFAIHNKKRLKPAEMEIGEKILVNGFKTSRLHSNLKQKIRENERELVPVFLRNTGGPDNAPSSSTNISKRHSRGLQERYKEAVPFKRNSSQLSQKISLSPRLLINNRLFMKRTTPQILNKSYLPAIVYRGGFPVSEAQDPNSHEFNEQKVSKLGTVFPFVECSNVTDTMGENVGEANPRVSSKRGVKPSARRALGLRETNTPLYEEYGIPWKDYQPNPRVSSKHGGSEEVLTKRKSIQKKRRITKIKKETRRRKKRMRFYPRPLWLRYRFYSQFLKDRRSNKFPAFLQNAGGQEPIYGLRPNFKEKNLLYPVIFDCRRPPVRFAHGDGEFVDTNSNLSLHHTPTPRDINARYSIAQARRSRGLRGDWFPYSAGIPNIDLSRSVMEEFKTAFWKSYWLRSNLNPYLKKMKASIKDIKQKTIYPTHVEFVPLGDGIHTRNNISKNLNSFLFSFLDARKSFYNSNDAFIMTNTTSLADIEKFSSQSENHIKNKKNMSSYYKTANSLNEYNEITSQRIKEFATRIRENLTLNGKTKIHPSRISINFASSSKNPKQKESNIFRKPTMRTDAMSRLRLYWAFSKASTNLALSNENAPMIGLKTLNPNTYNKRKNIWITEKYRQQTKENKTKRLFKDINNKIQILLNKTPYISNQLTQFSITQAHSSQNETPPPRAIENRASFAMSRQKRNIVQTLILKNIKKSELQKEKIQNLAVRTAKPAEHRRDRNIAANQFSRVSSKRGGSGSIRSRVFNPKMINNKYDLCKFKDRENQLFNFSQMNAKVQPFISGKANYWWAGPYTNPMGGAFNSVRSFIPTHKKFTEMFRVAKYSSPFTPRFFETRGSENRLRDISQIPNSLYLFPRFDQTRELNAHFKTGWTDPLSRHNQSLADSFTVSPTILSNSVNSSTLQVYTLLFYFCSLITILSLSQFRSVVKFFFIGINKIFNILDRIIPNFLFKNLFSKRKNIEITSDFSPLKRSNDKTFYSYFPHNHRSRIIRRELNPNNLTNKLKYSFNFNKSNSSFLYSFYSSLSSLRSQTDDGYKSKFSSRLNLNPLLRDSVARASSDRAVRLRGLRTFYALLIFSLKKPIVFSLKNSTSIQDFTKSNFIAESLKQKNEAEKMRFSGDHVSKENKGNFSQITFTPRFEKTRGLTNKLNIGVSQSFLSSLLFARFVLTNFLQFSKNTSTLFGQRPKLEDSFRSIYTFFEKPGVLIVDWVAYMFLVEWASDMTNTLPENVDLRIFGTPLNKLTRTIYGMNLIVPSTFLGTGIFHQFVSGAVPGFAGPQSNFTYGFSGFQANLLPNFTFLNLASPFLKRRIYHLYEILLFQIYQPDTDLIMRQRKGIVFWDIWGDFLTQIAEDSNLNLSELTSLKEEQIQLLENASFEISKDRSPTKPRSPRDRRSRGFTPRFEETRGFPAAPTVNDRVPPQLEGEGPYVSSSHAHTESNSLKSAGYFYSNMSSLLGIGVSSKRKSETKDQKFARSPHDLKSRGISRIRNINVTNKHPRDFGSRGKPRVSSKHGGSGVESHQWGSQQFLSYAIKSKDTELFIDLHPPRALTSVLQNKGGRATTQQLRALSPIGSLICQIFSGILSKQVSKNILIVGNSNQQKDVLDNSSAQNFSSSSRSSFETISSSSLEKTLLVQAIAGETELKIITDNAHRYALVYRGVAVGIKLLRDVFDSLSLQTPCFFLIEDIHAIGERRPFLMSDDTPEDGQNIEIHEKNQVLYQLSKHVISHYKKPYKGDFSLSIPTNHFCFDFFKGQSLYHNRFGKASKNRVNSVSPKIPAFDNSQGEQKNNTGMRTSKQKLPSRLLRSSTELLSPPATSPFSVLTLKEEKKLKTHKKVNELSWTGKEGISSKGADSANNDAQKTGPAYSVRAKVALLADMAISSLSVKLDMITDLLVIIDSVKGNRGFVVFATTHIPFVLDPALRRPGRFDETLSFSLTSKNHSWEVSQLGILNLPYLNKSHSPRDLPSYEYYEKTRGSQGFPNMFLPSGSSTHAVSLSPNFNKLMKKGGSSLDFNLIFTEVDKTVLLGNLSQAGIRSILPISLQSYNKKTSSLLHSFKNSIFLTSKPPHTLRSEQNSSQFVNNNNSQTPAINNRPRVSSKHGGSGQTNDLNFNIDIKTILSRKNVNSKILSQVALKASVYFTSVFVHFNQNSYIREIPAMVDRGACTHLDLSISNTFTQKSTLLFDSTLSNPSYLSLYCSPQFFKSNIATLISGKIGEFLLLSNSSQLVRNESQSPGDRRSPNSSRDLLSRGRAISDRTSYVGMTEPYPVSPSSSNSIRCSSLMPAITESITSLVLSFVQKRFLYKKTLFLPNLLDLMNFSSLMEPPSPPNSNIMLPARRYENLKRSLFFYQNPGHHFGSGIKEKINIHQQQRLVKRLYKIPVKESFQSEMIENRLSGFSNASLMIGNISPNHLQKTSNSNWLFKNRVLSRHSNSLTNQWWTGQLPEHNSETTFLSDIDWRYTFVEREGQDILLDFPDADQYYNPRNRRWMGLHKSLFSELQNSHSSLVTRSSLSSEIYTHFIYDSFLRALNIYEKNREVFDFYVFYVCKQGLQTELTEFERLKLIQRFFQN